MRALKQPVLEVLLVTMSFLHWLLSGKMVRADVMATARRISISCGLAAVPFDGEKRPAARKHAHTFTS